MPKGRKKRNIQGLGAVHRARRGRHGGDGGWELIEGWFWVRKMGVRKMEMGAEETSYTDNTPRSHTGLSPAGA